MDLLPCLRRPRRRAAAAAAVDRSTLGYQLLPLDTCFPRIDDRIPLNPFKRNASRLVPKLIKQFAHLALENYSLALTKRSAL